MLKAEQAGQAMETEKDKQNYTFDGVPMDMALKEARARFAPYAPMARQSWRVFSFGWLLLRVPAMLLMLLAAGVLMLVVHLMYEQEKANVVLTKLPFHLAPPDHVDPALEGKAIELHGEAKSPSLLVESRLGLSGPWLRLQRTVEMRQWVQITELHSTGMNQKYELQWRDTLENSAKYDATHQNPKAFPLDARNLSSSKAQIGPYQIDPDVLAKFPLEDVPLQAENMHHLPDAWRAQLHLDQGAIYLGDPNKPEVGQLRIRAKAVPQGVYSLLAEQQGNMLVPIHTKEGPASPVQKGNAGRAEILLGNSLGSLITVFLYLAAGLIAWNLAWLFGLVTDVLARLPIFGPVLRFLWQGVLLRMLLFFELVLFLAAWLQPEFAAMVPSLPYALGLAVLAYLALLMQRGISSFRQNKTVA